MFAALIVAESGTLNVAEGPQQVNIDAPGKGESARQEAIGQGRNECPKLNPVRDLCLD
jgi:hypothetical protein